ncbi:MAG: bifunctional 5,10-methylenetetrahydrofolate dehydrogenase/5,10-methenyltetrahydrofolate cyclohydrolase [bacterium]
MKFDGKALANETLETVRLVVAKMATKPKIVSFLVGNDPASELYTRLKVRAADKVSIKFEVIRIKEYEPALASLIAQTGSREDVTGVMVQLPVAGLQSQTLKEVLSAIPLAKDVDGLRWEESGITPATVRAIILILDKIGDWQNKSVVIVGARGAVGRPLATKLKQMGVSVLEVDQDTNNPENIIKTGDIVVSCVGKMGLVKAEMVKDGVIAIDVGGDMTKTVYQKASISLEVPGGVGPVTVASLMYNALEIFI